MSLVVSAIRSLRAQHQNDAAAGPSSYGIVNLSSPLLSSPASYLLRAAFIILQHIYSVRSARPIVYPSHAPKSVGEEDSIPCDHGRIIIACYVRYVDILRPNQRCPDLETRLAKANPAFAATPRSLIAQLLEQSIPPIPTSTAKPACCQLICPADPLSFLHIFMSFSPSNLLHTCNPHRILSHNGTDI